jgi:hypothetical protein
MLTRKTIKQKQVASVTKKEAPKPVNDEDDEEDGWSFNLTSKPKVSMDETSNDSPKKRKGGSFIQTISKDEDDDFIDVKKQKVASTTPAPAAPPSDKPICPYGANCYRKNPAHFQEYLLKLCTQSYNIAYNIILQRTLRLLQILTQMTQNL